MTAARRERTGLICRKCRDVCVVMGASKPSYWNCPDGTGCGDGKAEWKPFYGKVVE